MRYSSFVKDIEKRLAQAKARERLRPDPFWGYAERWPIDGQGFVFLGRAVDSLGASLFGEAWQGVRYAGGDHPFPRSENKEGASKSEVAVVCKLLIEEGLLDRINPVVDVSELALLQDDSAWNREVGDLLAWEIASSRIPSDLWDKACSILDLSELRPGAPMREQWDHTLRSLHQMLLSGRLRSFLRPREGGQPVPCETWMWNTEIWRSRFERCELDREQPFRMVKDDWGDEKNRSMFIYVSQDDITSLGLEIDSFEDIRLKGGYLSPFIQLMIRVSGELGLTKEGTALRKRQIVEALKRGWRESRPGDEPMGAGFWEALGTAMKEPGAQARRNSPEAKKV